MSYTVSYSTQIGPFPHPTQSSKDAIRMFLVYCDRMNQSQTDLMKDAHFLLGESVNVGIVTTPEIKSLPPQTKYFIIPTLREDVVKVIRAHADKPIIYTARAIIESRKYKNVKLPNRSLAISLSMMTCRVFLVKSCNVPDIRNKVNEMCGTVLGDFSDPKLNVVITDRADNKYCAKARSRNVAVVSAEWVNETYSLSKSEEHHHINHDALSTIAEYKIKAFLGLKFKISIPQLGKPLRNLIIDNHGKLAFGDEETTHIVARSYPDCTQANTSHNDSGNKTSEPRVVDVEFLEVCANLGYYLNRKEYRAHRESSDVKIKQEKGSQNPVLRSENCLITTQNLQRSTLSSIRSNGYDSRLATVNENQSMLPPPPSMPRQTRQQMSDSMNDLILRQLENGTQTQIASTQIRRLPETEIQIEQTLEPSQQLYWSDNFSRRH